MSFWPWRRWRWLRSYQPLLAFHSVLFAAGVVFGAYAVNVAPHSLQLQLSRQLTAFATQVSGQGLAAFPVWPQLQQQALLALVVLLSGLVFVSLVVAPGVIFFKGFATGFTTGLLFWQAGWRGLLFGLSALFPADLLIIPAWILLATVALAWGLRAFHAGGVSTQPAWRRAGDHLTVLAISFACLLLASALAVFVTPWLMHWSSLLISG